MNRRFILVSDGYWSIGETLCEAYGALKKVCGSHSKFFIAHMFESDLPFVPVGLSRMALDGESDCWMGRDGSLNWVRCDHTLLG